MNREERNALVAKLVVEDKERHPFLNSLPIWLNKHCQMGVDFALGEDKTVHFMYVQEINLSNLTEQEKKFVAAGGVIPSEVPKKTDASPAHYNLTLRHDSSMTWVSADGRETHIYNMVDQHLINTMRFLIRNFPSIKDMYLRELEALIGHTEKQYSPRLTEILRKEYKGIYGTKTAASCLEAIVKPFTALAEEITRRFGNRALRSLYDGE